MKNTIKDIYKSLVQIPTVSGFERQSAEKIIEVVRSYTGFFDRFEITHGGSVICYHKEHLSPKLLFDAHIDTVGFIVKEILPGGFVKVKSVGGIDTRILPGKTIEIYGNQTVKGVFLSVPPHLSGGENKQKGTSEDLFVVDTGYTDELLRSYVQVGTPCGFCEEPYTLFDGSLCGSGMDDKICAAAIILCAMLLEKNKSYSDTCCVIATFSAHEELSGDGAYDIHRVGADGAIVLDVNFGRTKHTKDKESYPLGSGCGVSYSSTVDRTLTEQLIFIARAENIPLQTMVETTGTGTNAHNLQKLGTPCAVLSVPEKYMHTYNETVNCDDVVSAARLLCALVKSFPEYVQKASAARIVKGEAK